MKHRTTDEFTVRELFCAKVKRARQHLVPFCFMVALVLVLYTASATIEPGWVTFWISGVALMVTAITSLSRLNDLLPEQVSKRWQARRVGLIMCGAAAIGLLVEPLLVWAQGIPMVDFPSWREVMMRWGFALVWITTPHMPPWWRYVSGQYKTEREARRAKVASVIVGLDPKDDAPVYTENGQIERRHGGDRREIDT